jgi:hypothetical protein
MAVITRIAARFERYIQGEWDRHLLKGGKLDANGAAVDKDFKERLTALFRELVAQAISEFPPK